MSSKWEMEHIACITSVGRPSVSSLSVWLRLLSTNLHVGPLGPTIPFLSSWIQTPSTESCAVHCDGQYIDSPRSSDDVVDAVGAGDAFTAGFLHGRNEGWSLSKTCEFANQLGALVASKPGALTEWWLKELQKWWLLAGFKG
jgi:hypothetical protein